MKDLGLLSYFVGIAIKRHSSGMFRSQQKYAEYILKRADMSSCNPVYTHIDSLDRNLAGALQYLTFTRLDITYYAVQLDITYYAVQQVCLHMHDLKKDHMAALERILRYLRGTISHGIHLYKSSLTGLVSYTDADRGGFPDTRRSISDYCIFLTICSLGLPNDSPPFPALMLKRSTAVLLTV